MRNCTFRYMPSEDPDKSVILMQADLSPCRERQPRWQLHLICMGFLVNRRKMLLIKFLFFCHYQTETQYTHVKGFI